ncbi:hypothetical protein NDU88_002813 [Pleurodeles waltl]|uniref:Uncharacterized protein n=1 Tax=Pleurodeles waltl TaxID=8319 RepID=A0AAV7TMA5_PLEWA|nr:hypothetical protein NDU88_002813 [Pleurodeles waltl]
MQSPRGRPDTAKSRRGTGGGLAAHRNGPILQVRTGDAPISVAPRAGPRVLGSPGSRGTATVRKRGALIGWPRGAWASPSHLELARLMGETDSDLPNPI